MTLLHLVSYAGTLSFLLFAVLSLANGLLYIAELIEEHSSVAKVVGRRLIYAVIGLHLLLYLFDGLPLFRILFSIGCHFLYHRNISSQWPVISLSSLTFIVSCVCCLIDHFLWFSYFSIVAQEVRQRSYKFRGSPSLPSSKPPSFADVATFFVFCVWLVPLFLFLSLSANDNALPSISESATNPSIAFPAVAPTRLSIFKTLFSYLPQIRSRRRKEESIIALHSPSKATPRSPSMFSLRRETVAPDGSSGPSNPTSLYNEYSSQKADFHLQPPPNKLGATSAGYDDNIKKRRTQITG